MRDSKLIYRYLLLGVAIAILMTFTHTPFPT
jgi:hypothetical protein